MKTAIVILLAIWLGIGILLALALVLLGWSQGRIPTLRESARTVIGWPLDLLRLVVR